MCGDQNCGSLVSVHVNAAFSLYSKQRPLQLFSLVWEDNVYLPWRTLFHQLRQQSTPLLSEKVGSRQAAVASDHTQVGDAAQDQVMCRLQASLVWAELFASSTADDSAPLGMNVNSCIIS